MTPVHDQGRSAYAAGLGLKDNPSTDAAFAWQWRKGWLLARREDRKRRRALRRAGDYAAWPTARIGEGSMSKWKRRLAKIEAAETAAQEKAAEQLRYEASVRAFDAETDRILAAIDAVEEVPPT